MVVINFTTAPDKPMENLLKITKNYKSKTTRGGADGFWCQYKQGLKRKNEDMTGCHGHII